MFIYQHSKPNECQKSSYELYFINIPIQSVNKMFVYIADCNPSLSYVTCQVINGCE